MGKYKPPIQGTQTVQIYHPERGERFRWQVSTYNGDSWLIKFCSQADLPFYKNEEMKRATGKESYQCLKLL